MNISKLLIGLLWIITSLPSSLYSQTAGTLRGYIIDAKSSEALPYANVILEGTKLGASADLKGNFIIRGIPAGKTYTAIFSYIGYVRKKIPVRIVAANITQLTVELEPGNLELKTVEKIGNKYEKPNETDLGLQRINVRDIELMPKGVETDIFRTLQAIPGVQSTGDVSARYYVRGGASNQNLVLLNGVSVYNPFHALGLFSIIDPEMINAVEFYKGGFTADYGGRLSSVLNLITKDGNKSRFGGSANISFLTGKGEFDGPFPGGSFIFTGRKSLFDQTLKKFVNKNAPFNFYDFSGKINFTSTDTKTLTKVSANIFKSEDKMFSGDPAKADYRWINDIYSAYWFQAWEDVPIYSEANLSYSKFNGQVIPNYSSAKERVNILKDITLRGDFTYIYQSRDEMKVGFKLKSIETDLRFENLQGVKSNVHDNGLHLSIYGKYRFLRYNNFGADFGTRINVITLTQKSGAVFEPRINLTYNLLPSVSLKAAFGIYTQELITLTNENEIISIFEPWIITPEYLKPSEAIHYVAGIDFAITSDLSLATEFYYKDYKSLAEINENKFNYTDPDFIAGTGKSRGAEFQIKYNTGKINFSFSYALSYAYRIVNNYKYYPRYDSRNNVSAALSYNLGAGWHAGVQWIFSSGHPFTQMKSFYDKLYVEDLFQHGFYGDFKPYTILAEKNLGRLPDYHRLDLSLTKRFKLFFSDVSLSFNVLNVYNRKNIFYFNRENGERVNMLPVLPSASLRIEL